MGLPPSQRTVVQEVRRAALLLRPTNLLRRLPRMARLTQQGHKVKLVATTTLLPIAVLPAATAHPVNMVEVPLAALRGITARRRHRLHMELAVAAAVAPKRPTKPVATVVPVL